MKIILDAQLSPKIASWLRQEFGVKVIHVRDLNMMSVSDYEIFKFAKKEADILISKDSDFIEMIEHFGLPPQLIWLTVGNTTNHSLQRIFMASFKKALDILKAGVNIVEIKGVH